MKQTIGIVGLGRMGRCLVQGLLESGTVSKNEIFFTTKHQETSDCVEKELGIRKAATNQALIKACQIVILAVKPQNIDEVLEELVGCEFRGKLFISIIASVTTHHIENVLAKKVAVARAMPNTPAFVRAGMTAVAMGQFATDSDWQIAERIFKPLGRTRRVDEKHMNAVTGLSGCGPAYIYVVLEALTEAGIKVGLSRDLATELSAQTVLGAAKMLLDTGRHPAALKDEVTTPAGCTIDGLLELEEGKLRVTLMKAVVSATNRAQKLAKTPPSPTASPRRGRPIRSEE